MAAVSIITPAWNAAAHIAETIASVRAQTWQDWEWLIVDDGSTDATAAIVGAAAAQDPRIRLLRQPNAGPSAARNRAMHEASGEWLAFLDSDDGWHPRFLATQLAIFSIHAGTDLVTGTAINRGGPFDRQPTRRGTEGEPVLSLDDIIRDETSVFIMTVFRRAVFDTIGGLDEAQWTSEDYDFWLRAAQAGFVFRCNPEPLGWYRIRGESLSRQRNRMLEGLLVSYRKAAARMVPGAPERRGIDAQIARFESEFLLEQAKLAIEQRDFAVAAAHLDALRARGGGALVAVTAWLARHAPRAAVLAYRLRAWRPRSLTSLTNVTAVGPVEGGPHFASQP
jgi:teichuronic acid biosynthesis glycosyltransferase TuaG